MKGFPHDPPNENDFITFAASHLSDQCRVAIQECPDVVTAQQTLMTTGRWVASHPLLRRVAIYWTAQDAYHGMAHTSTPNMASNMDVPGVAWANGCFDILDTGDGPHDIWPWSQGLFEWVPDEHDEFEESETPELETQSGAMAGLLLTYSAALQPNGLLAPNPECPFC